MHHPWSCPRAWLRSVLGHDEKSAFRCAALAVMLRPMELGFEVISILRADQLRWHLLGVVSSLGLPDSWIGAGFVRNAVWDFLHDRAPSPLKGDVDVIWFDRSRTAPGMDKRYESILRELEPSINWSVKNQARMHIRNDDSPYASAIDAMRFWPETATAVAARRSGDHQCEIAAPLGLEDLFGLVLRPGPRFSADKRHVFEERAHTKRWLIDWPLLCKADG